MPQNKEMHGGKLSNSLMETLGMQYAPPKETQGTELNNNSTNALTEAQVR